jgi:hypothetical protein
MTTPELPTPIAPNWWTTCRENGHDVTIFEKEGGMSEFFCSDCSRGESSALRPTARITSFLGKKLERPIPLYGTNGDSESQENNDLSISIQDDALGISMVMDDQMRRIALYEGIINDIRKALGDDGLHAQLLDLPKLVAERVK